MSKNALRSSNDVWHDDERIIGFGSIKNPSLYKLFKILYISLSLRSGTSSLSYSSGRPGPLENELDVLCDRADATLDPIWHLKKIGKKALKKALSKSFYNCLSYYYFVNK